MYCFGGEKEGKQGGGWHEGGVEMGLWCGRGHRDTKEGVLIDWAKSIVNC